MIRISSSILLFILFAAIPTGAGVVTYEGDAFPETEGWQRIGTFDVDRWIDKGRFHHFCDLGVWPGPRFGEDDFYQRSVSEFASDPTFFIAWRIQTDVPSSVLDFFGTPTALAGFGSTSAWYNFTFTEDRILVMRSTSLPLVYADIIPDIPHSYYLELHGLDEYAWYIDGQLIDSGVPALPFPTLDSAIIWGARHDTFDNHAQWDYIRYGTIPQPSSGDFDSNGVVDQTDVFFFVDCLLGPDADGPGCRWADMNGDTLADGADIQLFAEAMIGP